MRSVVHRHNVAFPAAPRPSHSTPRRPVSTFAASAKVPMSAKVLTGILRSTEVPFSSYLAFPRTPLHFVDARIKQVWLIAVLVLIPRVLWQFRVVLAAAVLVLSVLCLPKRLSTAQLRRLLPLCALVFLGTACSADQIVMATPAHTPPPDLLGLPSLDGLNNGYKYVLCKFFFITVSRFSLSLAATIACITFAALQLTSLFLITTPPESAASAFRWFATPLRLFGVKLDTLTFQLLLSLRFVSLVFEEVRNLCLGLASRGVVWPAMARSDVMATWILLFTKLFANLFERSSRMAESLVARGFKNPEDRYLNVPLLCPSTFLANAAALLALSACIGATFWFQKV